MDISKIVSNGEEATWHTVPGTEEGEHPVRIQVKPMKPKRRRTIVKMCTKRIRIRGQLDTVLDEEKLNRLILLESVVGWENIEMDGNSLEITDENKILLDDTWANFSNLWNAVVGEQNRLDEAIEAASLGN